MSYSVMWHPRTRKFLHRLPEDISSRVVKKVNSIKESPFRFLEHYEGDNVYKLRIGDYRALIDADFKNKVLLVQLVGHRKNIYKKWLRSD